LPYDRAQSVAHFRIIGAIGGNRDRTVQASPSAEGRVPINFGYVRFAPTTTTFEQAQQMTRCATTGLMHRSKKSEHGLAY
jgi:hypothetical protein